MWGATGFRYSVKILFCHFNPRAPCGARRCGMGGGFWKHMTFQSTRPVWGATGRWPIQCCGIPDFNPRAPCGARRAGALRPVWPGMISIHAPRVGRDNIPSVVWLIIRNISIHAPRVGRDHADMHFLPFALISIHAPRVGRDQMIEFTAFGATYFNPRAPCGARPQIVDAAWTEVMIFQSTRPVWGATSSMTKRMQSSKFQSTRPVWGATL